MNLKKKSKNSNKKSAKFLSAQLLAQNQNAPKRLLIYVKIPKFFAKMSLQQESRQKTSRQAEVRQRFLTRVQFFVYKKKSARDLNH